MSSPTEKDLANRPANFLRGIIERDLEQGTYSQRYWGGSPGDAAHHRAGHPDPARIRTRFPPEPNGYLHVGHAKSICLNFGLARDYGGICHLRFDDTNPEKEEIEYVEAIKDAVHWLGFDWDAHGTRHQYQASDYFDFMYRAAEYLVEAGLAYVDEQSPEQMRANRGDFGKPGVDSPFRSRSIEENLTRLRDMRDGRLADGAAVLRAKIDMASPNINLRDPTLYRIKRGSTTTRAASGASIRCTPSRTRSRMRWRTSPTASARWSSRTSGPSTTGWSRTWPKAAWSTRRRRASMNSRA